MREKARSAGFSIIELLVVIAIILVVSAMAIPQINGAIDAAKLRSAVTDIDGLVQQDRIQSVRDNKAYTLKQQASSTGNGVTLFVSTDGGSTATAGEPAIQLPTTMAIDGTGPGTAAPGVAGATPAYTVVSGTSLLSFNERGLPCSNPPVCNSQSPYVMYFSQTRSKGTGWAAITVTLSGRIKAYTWTGTAWQ